MCVRVSAGGLVLKGVVNKGVKSEGWLQGGLSQKLRVKVRVNEVLGLYTMILGGISTSLSRT
jgi:hypothetical protein